MLEIQCIVSIRFYKGHWELLQFYRLPKKTPERVENVIIKKLLCCVFAAVKGRKLKPRCMWFIQVTVLTVKTNVSFVFAGYSSHRVTSLILTERIHPYQSVLWWELELLRASLLQFSNPRIIGLLLTN